MDLTARDAIPADADAFLAAAGWGGATIAPLAGDASFRRYFRVEGARGSAMLMDAPPPHEDPKPFLRAAKWLDSNGMRAPRILAEDAARGLVLIEDFGEVRMREYLDQWPADEAEVYAAAVEALARLHRLPPGPFTAYGFTEYLRETRLLTEWWAPAQGLAVDAAGYDEAWQQVLAPLLARQRPGVTVLRDYHAENIMLLGGLDRQGLLDFQDALVGHRAYDLVSLLQDARLEVPEALERDLLARYCAARGAQNNNFSGDRFVSLYAPAVDVLLAIASEPTPTLLPVEGHAPYRLPPYDEDAMLTEALLLVDWFWPALNGRPTPEEVHKA